MNKSTNSSDFIPNKIVKVKPQQAPWITMTIKSFLLKRNRAYKSFVKNGYSQERSEIIQQMKLQGTRLVEEARKVLLKNRQDAFKGRYWQ